MGVEQRMAKFILAGGPFSANEVTDCGRVTFDVGHAPNAGNNKIGAVFNAHVRAGHIRVVGTTTSCAPHRKGGLIRSYVGTASGRAWAASL